MTVDTRERLVLTAMRLFADKGYESTSIADVLKAAGANSGSLYHYFPTKQNLLLEVLKRYRGGIRQMLLEPAWQGVTDPIERVFALLASYRSALKASDCTYGCPIGSLALELHEPDPPVRELLALNFEGWVDAIQECYAAAHLAKRDVRGLSVFTLTVMEGAVMQARTQRLLDPFDRSVAMLRDYIDRLRKDTKPRRKK